MPVEEHVVKCSIRVRAFLERRLRSRSKHAFLELLPIGARLLDVGCGRDPINFLIQRPDLDYTGLDVTDEYRQHLFPNLCARHISVPADQFENALASLEGKFDAVISSHNLEHCDHPEFVLSQMIAALKPNGRIYLAFPCEQSIYFPKRHGTLNFFDDATHQRVIKYTSILRTLQLSALQVEFSTPRYRPCLLFLIGLILEPISMLTKRVLPGTATWAFYGFESIIWATKISDAASKLRSTA